MRGNNRCENNTDQNPCSRKDAKAQRKIKKKRYMSYGITDKREKSNDEP